VVIMAALRRGSGFLLLLAGLALALLAAPVPAAAQSDRVPVVNVVRLSGAIDSAYAGYLRGELDRSEERGDLAVVLQLVGSGSIGVDAAALVERVKNAEVPVVAWVGPIPLGRSEAIAGTHTALWLAADLRFVANGAEVRSMQPLQPGGSGAGLPDVLAALDADADTDTDTSALAGLLDRGGELSDRAVLDRGLATPVPRTGDSEGRITPGSVNSIADVVRALDGRTFDLGSRSATVELGPDLQSFDIRNANPGLITRVRQALGTNPTLVYLLLVVGAGAVVFELFQPGFGPAGYSGVLLLALAGYGLLALPTSPLGALLTLAGLALLAVDVARGGLGLVTWGGTVALTAGSLLLFESEGSALRVPWPYVVLGVAGSWIFYVVVMTVVLRALRGQSAQLGQALVGRIGEVRSTLNPQGHVLVEGGLWRARALEWDGPVAAGTRVEVTGVDEEALLLDVVPVDESASVANR
jgi:membrane-bound serine protease (ClpP class)